MSVLLSKIKTDALTARKNAIKDKSEMASIATSIYSTLVGAITRISVDERREVTDADCINTVRKILKGIDETISFIHARADKDPSDASNTKSIIKAIAEKQILTEYLPQQMSEGQLEDTIVNVIFHKMEGPRNKGTIFKALKTQFDGQYDSAMAATIINKILS